MVTLLKLDIKYYKVENLFPEFNPTMLLFQTESNNGDGILNWIGTSRGNKEYVNPYVSGDVIITSSSVDSFRSLGECSGGYAVFVRKELTGPNFGTVNLPNMWIAVDLKSILVQPSGYRLVCNRKNNCHPRNWNFEGSNDGLIWVKLSSHNEDLTFVDVNEVGYWNIKESEEKYRCFRIYQHGFSNGGYNHLVCCSLEIYGKVYHNEKF